jgi:hypothetical protein
MTQIYSGLQLLQVGAIIGGCILAIIIIEFMTQKNESNKESP